MTAPASGNAEAAGAGLYGGQCVVLVAPYCDSQGRLLAEPGDLGVIAEELDTAPGWWLVRFEKSAQCWPTPGALLRSCRGVVGGNALRLPALLAILRTLLRAALSKTDEAEQSQPEQFQRRLMVLLEYVTGRIDHDSALGDLIGLTQGGSCQCAGSGVCSTCDGRGGRCRKCRGSRLCQVCPRMLLSNERIGEFFHVTGRRAAVLHERTTRPGRHRRAA